MKTLDALPANDNTNAPDNVPDPTHNQTFQDAVNPPGPPTKRARGRPNNNDNDTKKRTEQKANNRPRNKKCKSAYDSVSDQYYEIERFKDKKTMPDGSVKYLCKWKGYSNQFCSWEPADSLNAKAKKIVQSTNIPYIT